MDSRTEEYWFNSKMWEQGFVFGLLLFGSSLFTIVVVFSVWWFR